MATEVPVNCACVSMSTCGLGTLNAGGAAPPSDY